MTHEGLTKMTKVEVVVSGSEAAAVRQLFEAVGATGFTSLSGVSGLGHGGYHQGRLLFNEQDGARALLISGGARRARRRGLLAGLRPLLEETLGGHVRHRDLRQPAGVLPVNARPAATAAPPAPGKGAGRRSPRVALVGAGQLARMTHQAGDRARGRGLGCSAAAPDAIPRWRAGAARLRSARAERLRATLRALAAEGRTVTTLRPRGRQRPSTSRPSSPTAMRLARRRRRPSALGPGQAARARRDARCPRAAGFPVPGRSSDSPYGGRTWRAFAAEHGWARGGQGAARRLRRPWRVARPARDAAAVMERALRAGSRTASSSSRTCTIERELAVPRRARAIGRRAHDLPGRRDRPARRDVPRDARPGCRSRRRSPSRGPRRKRSRASSPMRVDATLG